jgi:hypothetical protein
MKYVLTFLLWRNYKVLIVTTVLFVISIILINMAHSDFLTWAQMQEPVVATGASFIYKYLAYAALLLGFCVINHVANKKLEAEELASANKGNVILDKIIALKTQQQKKSAAKAQAKSQAKANASKTNAEQGNVEPGCADDTSQAQPASSAKPDPFANIRKKAKLRSQADMVLEKQSKK